MSNNYEEIQQNASDNSFVLNKIAYTLQTSICRVVWRSANLDRYQVVYHETGAAKDAILMFDSKFYVLNGYPKLGDAVMVQHNNQNDAHILFSTNTYNKLAPPYNGEKSQVPILPSSAKMP